MSAIRKLEPIIQKGSGEGGKSLSWLSNKPHAIRRYMGSSNNRMMQPEKIRKRGRNKTRKELHERAVQANQQRKKKKNAYTHIHKNADKKK